MATKSRAPARTKAAALKPAAADKPAAAKPPARARAAGVTVAAPAKGPVGLRRIAKGTRPQFYENAAVDQLFAVITALTAEVSVAFDRIDTLERLLVAEGAISSDHIESFVPTEAAADARSTKREALIQRVFAVFEAYGAGTSR